MEQSLQEQVRPDELELIQARSAAQFALTPIGLQIKQFEVQQRMAKMYASSTIVPANFQGDANLGNCVIAIDMASRMNASVLMTMQNLVIVKGNPTWSSKFLIATINACGKFSPIRYVMVGKPGEDSYGCKCVAFEASDKEHKFPLEGTTVTIAMAKSEGWYSKKDREGKETSKWQSMPEQMLRYRAAAFWQRVYAPEIGMGFLTTEEQEDIDDQTQPIYTNVREEIAKEANKTTLNIEAETPSNPAGSAAKTPEKGKKAKEGAPEENEAPASVHEEKPMAPSDEYPDFMKN